MGWEVQTLGKGLEALNMGFATLGVTWGWRGEHSCGRGCPFLEIRDGVRMGRMAFGLLCHLLIAGSPERPQVSWSLYLQCQTLVP